MKQIANHTNIIQFFLCLLLFIFLIVFSIYHAQFGVDLTDEGTYLATSMRLTLGDLPYRDEARMGVTAFNILLSPIFKYFPGVTLFQMRLLGISINTIGFILLFILFRNFAPPFITAITIGVVYLVNNYFGIWTPSYNLMASTFSLTSICFFIFSIMRNQKSFILPLVSGVLFAGAVINYFTLIFAAIVPLVYSIFVYLKSKRVDNFIQSTLFFYLGLFLALSFSIMLLNQQGLVNDLIAVGKINVGFRIGGIWDKLYFLVSSLFFNLRYTAILLLASLLNFPYSLVFSLLSIFILRSGTNLQLYYYSIYLGTILLILKLLIRRKNKDFMWNKISQISILGGILISIIFSVSSDEKTMAGVMGMPLVFTAGIIGIYRIANPKIRLSLIISLLVILYSALQYNYNTVYRDDPIVHLTQSFSVPKLAGIYSSPQRVAKFEELLSYISPRVKPGEYLLTYNNFPLLYYLTHTRPSYGFAWIRGSVEPESIRVMLFEKMIKEKREPNYVVRIIAPPGYDWKIPLAGGPVDEDPIINNFVFSNYILEKTIYPFEIWKNRSYESPV